MYDVGLEPWTDRLWLELKALAEAHFEEVDGGVEPNRPFRLDLRQMRLMDEAGVLKVVVARAHGAAVGYFTWNIGMDVESEGLVAAWQGAWYAAPGHFKAADRLWSESVKALKLLGVQHLFPHHRVQGRGSHLGRFFQRRGAKLIQHTYSLWIGDQHGEHPSGGGDRK